MYIIYAMRNKEIKMKQNEKRFVYGTRTNKWYLVDASDRDFETGISQDRFKELGFTAAKELYLRTRRI